EGNWKMLPDFDKLEAKKTGVVEDIGLSIQDQRDNFGIVFSGYLKIAEKGEYIFSIRSDDGTRVILAGKEIILNDGIHDMIPAPSQPVLLTPGFYRLRLDYFEAVGGEGIEISVYSTADGVWNRIPKSMLYRRK
ncbi:MAG: PA14 domain-containing protein, partial [Roseibacillus sp.]|nr:PA14 domain-containing protein [Roseibacillus sp.]